ncbi:MAG: hypothetical protein K0R83_3041 [Caulobacter sp.]|nr:hypothetical protein [Caulobacter sp.]
MQSFRPLPNVSRSWNDESSFVSLSQRCIRSYDLVSILPFLVLNTTLISQPERGFGSAANAVNAPSAAAKATAPNRMNDFKL